jgi:Tfp pilus assembly protein FimT
MGYQLSIPSISRSRGITLIEIVLSLAILGTIALFSVAIFSTYLLNKAIDTSTEAVFSAFSRAYLDTIGSRNDQQYGVHIDGGEVVVFTGTTYDPFSVDNVVYPLAREVEIVSVSLVSGGSDVVYQRITGNTVNSGTFILQAKRDSSKSRMITIHPTGMLSR